MLLSKSSGKKTESFNDSSKVGAGAALTLIILIIIAAIIYGIMYSVGAAKLSYSYNMHIGSSGGAAFGYSILCFFFSGLYYPYYAWFLNPITTMQKPNIGGIVGGRRR